MGVVDFLASGRSRMTEQGLGYPATGGSITVKEADESERKRASGWVKYRQKRKRETGTV